MLASPSICMVTGYIEVRWQLAGLQVCIKRQGEGNSCAGIAKATEDDPAYE